MTAESQRRAKNRKYAVQRALLIQLMGSKCCRCSERRPWRLEFHHTSRVTWCPTKTSRHRRIRLWARDWGLGLLTLACGRHNKQMGQPDRVPGEDEDEGISW